jgi:hypothetical protein
MAEQPELRVRLWVPPDGIRTDSLILLPPGIEDVDELLPGFTDPELREAGNLPSLLPGE